MKSLDEECIHHLLNQKVNKALFRSCCFYLVGFEDNEYYNDINPHTSRTCSKIEGGGTTTDIVGCGSSSNTMLLSQESSSESIIFKTKCTPSNGAFSRSSYGNSNHSFLRNNNSVETAKQGKQMLQKLIRKYLGTIFWNVHESLTHVIVADGIDMKLRNDVINFCRYHPNKPHPISPYWIIESVKKQNLQSCKLFPPQKQLQQKQRKGQFKQQDLLEEQEAEAEKEVISKPIVPILPTKIQQNNDCNKNNINTIMEVKISKNMFDQNENYKKRNNEKNSNTLFQGNSFYIITPPSSSSSSSSSSNNDRTNYSSSYDTIKFDKDRIEQLIIEGDGILLSSSYNNNENNDNNNNNNMLTKKNINSFCYIVHLEGNIHINTILEQHPLLSSLRQEQPSCQFISINPIWIETCTIQKSLFSPNQYPQLFQPIYWPMYKLPNYYNNDTNKTKKNTIKVSVSGFQNQQRIGIQQLLLSIGAIFTDNMSSDNTHLICKEAKGPKYHKAIEWGLYVVNIDWLYHIVRYGYSGKKINYEQDDNNRICTSNTVSSEGCENMFSMFFSPRRVKPVINNDVGIDEIVKDGPFVHSSCTSSDGANITKSSRIRSSGGIKRKRHKSNKDS